MTDSFDPYHKWLGIPPKEQPPNRYRLLGLALFEADPDVIESAADQRMAHVRTFQAGSHSALSQKLLNELAEAKLCLLKPEKKQQYDELLRCQASAAAPPPSATATPPAAAKPAPAAKPRPLPEAPISVASGPSISVSRSVRAKKSSGAGATLAVVGLAIAVFGGGIAYWQVQGGPTPIARVPSPSPEREPSISDAATDAAPNGKAAPQTSSSAPSAAGEAASPMTASPNAEPLNPSASRSDSNSPLKAPLESDERKPPQSDFAFGAAKKAETQTPEIKPPQTQPATAADEVQVSDLALDKRPKETSLPIREKKPAAPPRPRLAPKDAISHNESWYWFSEDRVTVQEAQAIANRLKGKLVTITSDEENQFIAERLKGPTFLGLLKVKNIWIDPGGRPQNYFRWDRGQPSSGSNERFAAILRNGRWHDYLEDRLFLCIEWGREP